MIIKHNNKTLPLYIDVVNTFFGKLKGLMFDKSINRGMLFQLNHKQRIGIHTLFMYQTIDVIFVNDNKVSDIVILNPWQF